MGDHALLSPSGASIWLHCTPAPRLSEDVEDTTSIYAEEGTEAHSLCEYKVRTALGFDTEDPRPGMKYLDSQMEECSDAYRDFIMQIVEEARKAGFNPTVLVEQRLDISGWVPGCFGTADCIVVFGDTLKIIDFKYGMGVPVSAVENCQMMIYALGACDLFADIYDIENVDMTIFQPRISNISSWNLEYCVLWQWASDYLSPRAELADKGEGELNPGEWCRFCRVKAICKARAEANMALARMEFRKASLLSTEELIEVMDKIDDLKSWVEDVKEYVYGMILHGGELEGWKLVSGRSTRAFTDDDQVAAAVSEAGFDPYDTKLKSVAALEKVMGKEKFTEVLSQFVTKPKGKPTLVRESDRRKAIVINDFNDSKEK